MHSINHVILWEYVSEEGGTSKNNFVRQPFVLKKDNNCREGVQKSRFWNNVVYGGPLSTTQHIMVLSSKFSQELLTSIPCLGVVSPNMPTPRYLIGKICVAVTKSQYILYYRILKQWNWNENGKKSQYFKGQF